MKHKHSLVVFLCIALVTPMLFATTAEEVAKKYEQNTTYKSSEATVTLTIQDNLGTSKQTIKTWKNSDNDTLIEIISGPDKGQKVLRKDDMIYLYYPDADQIIRLQGAALKDSFMGSDFSYEDLSEDTNITKNYTITLTDEDQKSYTLLLVAKTRKMVYQKQKLVIDKNTYALLSATLMSASGRELRALQSSNMKQVGSYFIPFTTVMTDLIKRQGSTTMNIQSIDVDKPLDPRLFTKGNLSW